MSLRSSFLFAALLLVIVSPSSSAAAQRARHGRVDLSPGFAPDPQVVAGSSGGVRSATGLRGDCQGWIANNPDHVVNVSGRFDWMRLFVLSDVDTTLVIQTPEGHYVCNDDAFGRNPSVEQSWGPGTYRIWVGSYRRGQHARYRLHFTENRRVSPERPIVEVHTPPPMAEGSNFERVQLSAGFAPDPFVTEGNGGGHRAASGLRGECRGWIADRPDHVFYAGHFRWLRIFAVSGVDTTLVIQGPRGQVLCSDDRFERNPGLEQEFEAGLYRIWVGSYREGARASYRLAFTERPTVTPDNLLAATSPTPPVMPGLDLSGTSNNYGRFGLHPQFSPDPRRSEGTTGSELDSSGLGLGCTGWISRRPDHVMELRDHFSYLKVFVNSQSDTTLIIRDPDGRFFCDDDTGPGVNPQIEQQAWRRGQYLIWVGTRRRGENGRYSLGVTELSHVNQ